MHSIALPHFLQQQWKCFSQQAIPNTEFTQLLEQLAMMRQDKLWVQEITQEELKTGVLCPVCAYEQKMVYVKGSWFCRSCGIENSDAFDEALQDYRLLRECTITNAVLCKEFNIPSKYIAHRILQALKFEKVGNNRYSKYKIPEI